MSRPRLDVTLAVVALGGALGSLARYGLGMAFPAAPAGFPWATFAINVSGSLLIGVLMALVSGEWAARPLIRPFLAVGVLGGFTTFSAYIVDAQRLFEAGAVVTALAYVFGTLALALTAVHGAHEVTLWIVARRAP